MRPRLAQCRLERARAHRRGNHLLEVGMNDHRAEYLMLVGHHPAVVLLHLTRRTENLLRRKVPGAVKRQQVTSVSIGFHRS